MIRSDDLDSSQRHSAICKRRRGLRASKQDGSWKRKSGWYKVKRAERKRCLFLAHLYGPAVRCKPEVMIWRLLVLRFCIRPLSGAFALLAIMDIRAHLFSFASRP